MRTAAEIVARVREVVAQGEDVFGFQRGDLLTCLAYADAKPFLSEGTTAAEWATQPAYTDAAVRARLVDYLPFAVDKALDHRGLSAMRSVQHLQAWTWLLGDYDRFDWDRYQNYGAPILRDVAEHYGVLVGVNGRFWRMSQGLPCAPNCSAGCGT